MSPLTRTGSAVASTTERTPSQSAAPVKNWHRVRPCTVMSLMPSASARRANSARVAGLVVPPEPHLERHWYADSLNDGADQRLRVIEIAH